MKLFINQNEILKSGKLREELLSKYGLERFYKFEEYKETALFNKLSIDLKATQNFLILNQLFKKIDNINVIYEYLFSSYYLETQESSLSSKIQFRKLKILNSKCLLYLLNELIKTSKRFKIDTEIYNLNKIEDYLQKTTRIYPTTFKIISKILNPVKNKSENTNKLYTLIKFWDETEDYDIYTAYKLIYEIICVELYNHYYETIYNPNNELIQLNKQINEKYSNIKYYFENKILKGIIWKWISKGYYINLN